VWTGAWAPGARLFATGSRDKQLRVWSFDPAAPACPAEPALSLSRLRAAVTAVAFAPVPLQGALALAVGFECGAVSLLRLEEGSAGELSAREVWDAGPLLRHAAAVRAIRWLASADALHMATCSSDHALRVFRVER